MLGQIINAVAAAFKIVEQGNNPYPVSDRKGPEPDPRFSPTARTGVTRYQRHENVC